MGSYAKQFDTEERAHATRASGRTGPTRGSRRRRPPGHRVLRAAPGPRRAGAARRVRHLRAPGLVPGDRVQRGPHRGHQPGHLRVPRGPGHRRAPLPRRRHARAVRAREGHRAGGVRRQRGHRPDRHRRRLHAHPGGVPRDPRPQPRPHLGPRGRRGGHPVAQPARRRGLQVQPAERRPGRLRRHLLDPGPRQRHHHGRPQGRTPHPVHPRARRPRHGPLRLPRHVRRRPAERPRPGRDPYGGGADRRRSAGRGVRRLLGAHRRGAPARPDRGQSAHSRTRPGGS